MVTAPLVVLLYDRIFIASSFMEIFRWRWPLCRIGGYLAGAGIGGGIESEDTGGVNPTVGAAWNYAITQFAVIVHYLRLCLWPSPLVLDYAWPLADNVSEVLLSAAIVLALLAATIFALVRQPWLGFWGAGSSSSSRRRPPSFRSPIRHSSTACISR
jgi:hypothetical protein